VVVGLLAVVSLSLADGLTANVVAYERDTAVFYFPLMSWVAQRLHQGELPLWTPQVFGGYPIFADGEIGLAYPPVLLALLTLPADRAFVLLRLLHLFLAAIGAFALARCWRLPYSSARWRAWCSRWQFPAGANPPREHRAHRRLDSAHAGIRRVCATECRLARAAALEALAAGALGLAD